MKFMVLCLELATFLVSVGALPKNQDFCDSVSWPETSERGIFDWQRDPIFPGARSFSVTDCGGQACRTDWPLDADNWRCVSCYAEILRDPARNYTEAWDYIKGDLARDNLINAWYHPSRAEKLPGLDFSQFIFFAFGDDNLETLDSQAECSMMEDDRCQGPTVRCGDVLGKNGDTASPFGMAVMDTLYRIHSVYRETDLALQRVRSKMQGEALEFVSNFYENFDPNKAKKDEAFVWDMVGLSLDFVACIPIPGGFMGLPAAWARFARGAEEAMEGAKKFDTAVNTIKWLNIASRGAKTVWMQENNGGPNLQNDPADSYRSLIEFNYQAARTVSKKALAGLMNGDSRESLDSFFELVKLGPPTHPFNTTQIEADWETFEYSKMIQLGWESLSTVHYRPFILASPKSENPDCHLQVGDFEDNFRSGDGPWKYDINEHPVADLPDFCYWLGGITDQSKLDHRTFGVNIRKKDAFFALPGHGSLDGVRFGGWTQRDIVMNSVNAWWAHGCTIPEDNEAYVMKDFVATESGVPERLVDRPWTQVWKDTPGLWRLPVLYFSLHRGNYWPEGLHDLMDWVQNPERRLPNRPYYGSRGYQGENGCPTHVRWIPNHLKEAALKAPPRFT